MAEVTKPLQWSFRLFSALLLLLGLFAPTTEALYLLRKRYVPNLLTASPNLNRSLLGLLYAMVVLSYATDATETQRSLQPTTRLPSVPILLLVSLCIHPRPYCTDWLSCFEFSQ